MVELWGHTAIKNKRYTASAYIAHTLGKLNARGMIAYRRGAGTGRWSSNSDISYWSLLPPLDWRERTSWVDVIGDQSQALQDLDVECRSYVLPGQ